MSNILMENFIIGRHFFFVPPFHQLIHAVKLRPDLLTAHKDNCLWLLASAPDQVRIISYCMRPGLQHHLHR